MKAYIALFLCLVLIIESGFVSLAFGEKRFKSEVSHINSKEKKIRIIFDNTELEKKLKIGYGDFEQFKWQYFIFWAAMFATFAYIYINRDNL